MLVHYLDKSPSYLRKIDSGQISMDEQSFEEVNDSVIHRLSMMDFKLPERPRDSALRKRNFNREGPVEEPPKPNPSSRPGFSEKAVKSSDNTGIVSYHLKPNPEYRLFTQPQAQQRPEEPKVAPKSQIPIRTEQRPFVAGGMLEEKVNYKNYNIFSGEFSVETEEGTIKQFEDVAFYSPRSVS